MLVSIKTTAFFIFLLHGYIANSSMFPSVFIDTETENNCILTYSNASLKFPASNESKPISHLTNCSCCKANAAAIIPSVRKNIRIKHANKHKSEAEKNIISCKDFSLSEIKIHKKYCSVHKGLYTSGFA